MTALALLLISFISCVLARTIKDDLKHLYTKEGRIQIGTLLGELDEIKLGYDEGGTPNAVLEPYFGEMVTNVGKAYVDFPSCPSIHLAFNQGQKIHLNAALLLFRLGADPNQYRLPEQDETQSDNLLYNRGYPPALLFALGLGQEPHSSHAGFLQRFQLTEPKAFNMSSIQRWRRETGNPPLVQLSIMLDNIDGAHVLLSHFDQSVHEIDADGITGLHIAAWRGNIPAMIMLLQAGANSSAIDNYGRTALHCVVMRGLPEPAAEILLTASEITAKCGKTDQACKRRSRAKLLAQRDNNGQTALDMASANPVKAELRKYLLNEHQINVERFKPHNRNSINTDIDEDEELIMDVVDATSLSVEQFRKEYFYTQRPVRIAGQLLMGVGIWAHLEPTALLERYGALPVRPLGGGGSTADATGVQDGVRKEVPLQLRHYLHHCFAGYADIVDPQSDAMGSQKHKLSDGLCKSAVFSPEASFVYAKEFADDVSVPEMFSSICTFPSGITTIDAVNVPIGGDSRVGVAVDGMRASAASPGGRDAANGDGGSQSSSDGMKKNAAPRPWTRHRPVEPLQVHAAAAMSATAFQAHNASWHVQLVGSKTWLLIPPGVDTEGILPTLEEGTTVTTEQIFNAVRALRKAQPVVVEVVQHPGDVLFVPHDWKYAWSHDVDSIAVSQEFCTFLHTDTRIQPLGTVLYGGEDPWRGMGLYKTHKKSSYQIGVTRPQTSSRPVFDFPPVT